MKVHLLPGTSTPTLTPLPGVPNAVHLIAARLRFLLNPKSSGLGSERRRVTFSLRFAQGERGAERLVPGLRSATGEPGTRDGSPFGGPLSAALAVLPQALLLEKPTG